MNAYLRRLSHLLRSSLVLLLIASTAVFSQTRQEHIHQLSHGVMPFDVSATVHVFKMTELGGIQRVIAKDPGASDQITLIQQHLRHEAMKFQHGDYADPATLHGADMPGLKDLQAAATRITVSYASLPTGAEITFTATELRLITALHRWFGAQLSEHGADARSE
ncbi:hypothetical protein [Accumulibacter sp.]|uniref:hypothetical protein n=1 Tax=Accumulibacter sp. TaxID=2053492 RepID=UPI0028C43B8D|nr:hypothetical protein [Accumulibacter sp.]